MAASSAGTFFMTPEEDKRVRQTIKDRLQRCQELCGEPREPTDANSLHSQAIQAGLMADIGSMPDLADLGFGDEVPKKKKKKKPQAPDKMTVLAVGSPYAPCTAPLDELGAVKLADLKMETHHRGKVLHVNRVEPVVKLTAKSWTVVEGVGEEGVRERLEFFMHGTRLREEVLEEGKMFKIKEPYFTLSDQGEATLRLDHPSDLVICDQDTDRPLNGTSDNLNTNGESSANAEKLAIKCKNEGNAALKRKDYLQALASYTKGLKQKTTLTADLYRNRAYVNLLLDRLDSAISDAMASLSGKEDLRGMELDSKAYFRAGCAAYKLELWQMAKSTFEAQQSLAPTDKDATMMLAKVAARKHEEKTGEYDFERMKGSISKTRPRLDAASFTSNTYLGNSPGRGRALFATKDLSDGDLILCEKAFCVVWGHEDGAWTAMTYDVRDDHIRGFPAGLSKAIVERLRHNPSQLGRFMDHYGDWKSIGTQTIGDPDSEGEGGAVVDVFQVHDIISRNAMAAGSVDGKEGEDVSNASTGLWTHTAYVNHSCVPNATREHIGDLLVLRATQPIKSKEEIFISYDVSSDFEARQASLKRTWGFECSCPLCLAEQADGVEVRKKRRELEEQAGVLVEKEDPRGAKRFVVKRAEGLVKSIDQTHDEERYEGLPRRAADGIRQWLDIAKGLSSQQTMGKR